MKPISIAFQCFGPYLEKQEIDFRELGADQMFLICGETGAGKTTILEAISYALYGKSADNLRGDMFAMRHEQAPAKMETFVEFIFECKGERYRFYRQLLPKNRRNPTLGKKTWDDFNTSYECQRYENGEFVFILDFKGRKRDIGKLAEEIIGLNHEQFCQVVLLPQGKFETFLTSNSADKEKILVSLFRLGRWEQVMEKIKKLAKEASDKVKEESEDIKKELARYGCTSVEELACKVSTEEKMVAEAHQKAEDAARMLKEKREEYESALTVNIKFEDLDKKKKTLEDLLLQQEEMEQEERSLESGKKAERLREAYQTYEAAKRAVAEGREEQATAAEKLVSVTETLRQVEMQRKAHNDRREEVGQLREILKEYENAEEAYDSLDERKKAATTGEAVYKKAKKKAEQKKKELSLAGEGLKTARENKRKADQIREQTYHAYLEGISVVVAETLEEGKPCPVCGSCHHPRLAVPAEFHVTKEQLEEKTKALKDAVAAEEEWTEKVQACNDDYAQAQTQEAEEKQRAEAAEKDYEKAKEKCFAHIPDGKALKKAIASLKEEILQYEEEEKTLISRVAAAEEVLKIAQKQKEAAERNMELVLEEEKAAIALWEEKRNAAGFDTDSHYLSACMDSEERDMRQVGLTEYHTRLKEARSAYETMRGETEGWIRPDVDTMKKDCEAREEEKSGRDSTYNSLRDEMEKMSKDLACLREKEEKNHANRERAESMTAFSDRLQGSNDISLQRYVLGVMLSTITAEANRILENVCEGRYYLYRTDESFSKKLKKGLELGVYSHDSPEGRSVKTLSGGEKFLVSLCLAIGLSTIVQSRGKGIQIGALFIDEGFGTLDNNRIMDAINVLKYIQRSSGMVGIISHVDALAEEIHTKIRIRKSSKGSTLKIET